MLDDETGDFSGDGEYDVPWSRETFNAGDRVKWTAKAIRYNIPTKTRRELCGTVVTADVGEKTSLTFTVTVLWDTYRRPHRYAASFITKIEPN